MQKTLKKARWFTVFVVPTLLAFLASFLAPFLMGIYLSFCKFTTVTNARWVGLDNYLRVFTDISRACKTCRPSSSRPPRSTAPRPGRP